MKHEVIVVGGGLGGLTTAALLAARGVDVCLFERQSRVGGCLSNFEYLGHEFEPTYRLYGGFESGGIFEQIFSELPADLPRIDPLCPSYIVRLTDGTDIAVGGKAEEFASELKAAFPECDAVNFYRQLGPSGSLNQPVHTSCAALLKDSSSRFREFIGAQLKLFQQCSTEESSVAEAAMVLNPRRRFWSINGGGQSLTDALETSLQKSGGTLRLNATVLRLAFGSDGTPIGVDLLTGERVLATQAIISSLTVWDTYGKLIGPSRAPRDLTLQLRSLNSFGVYLLFAGMDHAAAERLPARRILAVTTHPIDESNQKDTGQFFFSASAETNADALNGKLPVTISTYTNALSWFSFQEELAAQEEQDQQTLEPLWLRLHEAMPELGGDIEIIETATPQTYYETTRRKLGMVGRPRQSRTDGSNSVAIGLSPFPNLHIVSDTVAAGVGVEGVAQLARWTANQISSPKQK